MVGDVGRPKSTKFTRHEWVLGKTLRSAFFDTLEETGGVYEINESWSKTKLLRWRYHCRIAVYQLTKRQMSEFYHDFLDKYLNRQDFELRYMDNDSAYLEMSSDSLDESSI